MVGLLSKMFFPLHEKQNVGFNEQNVFHTA